MKLYCGTASGFARKARIVALELGLDRHVEIVFLSPQQDIAQLVPINPIGKVPVLVDGERAIFDSPVICEHFCTVAGDTTLLPPPGPARIAVLTAAALGDATLEAGMLGRAEEARDPGGAQVAWQFDRLHRCLAALEASERVRRDPAGAIDLGDIAIGAALGWLGFRWAERDLLRSYPATADWFGRLDRRASFQATRPFV